MSKTRKFEDVLDECLERLLVGNETIEQCLRRFPEHSDKLNPLLETALATRQISSVRPNPQFRERARQQLDTALRETGRGKSRVSFNLGWQGGWAVAVAIVLLVSLAGGGTVYAAAGSMPDSPLYTVKLATEEVQLALTFSEIGKAELHARLADKRVTEIVYLAEADKPEKLALTAERMNNNLTQISALVAAPEVVSGIAIAPVAEQPVIAREEPAPRPATTAEKVAEPTRATTPETTPAPTRTPAAKIVPSTKPTAVPEEPKTTTRAPTSTVPRPPNVTATEKTPAPTPAQAPTAQIAPVPSKATAIETAPGLKVKEETAIKVTPTPSQVEEAGKEANTKADQRAKLKITVQSQATSNTARLRSLLETAPESSKPALQRALNQSETEYKKAIEALK